MAPPESATVTDLAAARENRARGTDAAEAGAARRAPARKSAPRKPANRRFDKEKVDRLKAEIADGRYVIDATSVADRFIEHERNG